MKCHLTWYCSILLQCCCQKWPCGFARNKFGFANHLWSQRKLLGHFRDLQAAQMPQWLVVSPVMKDLIVAIPWRFCSTTKLDIDSSWDASYLHCNRVNRKEIEVSGTSVRCHNPPQEAWIAQEPHATTLYPCEPKWRCTRKYPIPGVFHWWQVDETAGASRELQRIWSAWFVACQMVSKPVI